MICQEIIEPAATEWASPIFVSPKKDGYLRLCMDYQKLNDIKVRDA